MANIMVVEDDRNTSRLMQAVLRHAGYNVFACDSAEDGLDLMEKQNIDLILLDVMLPGMDGFEFCESLRTSGNMTPILMVTARSLTEDRCKGFIAGTDDYMVKPVSEEEMLLRIKALLRRSKITTEHKIRIGEVTLDYDSLTVSRGQEEMQLPKKEFYLLFKLLSYPGKIFTRLQLMDEIWGTESESGENTINVHINRLRRHFETWLEFTIYTVRGIGYKAVVNV